jgi:pyruvate/2-oxoglutarate dehydrogenase complex dihydrolipoamide acyltransferase (E2) component
MNQEKLNQKIFQVISYLTKREVRPENYVTFFREIDCSVIEKIRQQYGNLNKKKPGYTAFIIKAASQAITEHPFVNARVFPGFPYSKIVKFSKIDTGVLCEKDIPGAEFMTFMDVIKNTDKKTIDEIQSELLLLANANVDNNPQLKNFINVIKKFPVFIARQLFTLPSIFPSLWVKYRGAGLVISSPCKYGVDSLATFWPHPLGLSFGLVKKKPVVKNNRVEIAPCFTITLCWDRRIMAGAPAARFFNSIATNLMDHEFLAKHLEESILIEERKIEKITAIA